MKVEVILKDIDRLISRLRGLTKIKSAVGENKRKHLELKIKTLLRRCFPESIQSRLTDYKDHVYPEDVIYSDSGASYQPTIERMKEFLLALKDELKTYGLPNKYKRKFGIKPKIPFLGEGEWSAEDR